MGLYTKIGTEIDEVFFAAFGNQEKVITALYPLALAALTIWIIWYGINTMRGATGNNAIGDFIVSIARIIFVFHVGVFGGAYAANISAAILGASAEFMTFFNIKKVGDVYNTLDNNQSLINKMTIDVLMAAARMPFSNLGQAIVMAATAILLALGLSVYLVLAACMFIGMQSSIHIILLLGPIFVFCLAFQKTESFFFPWFNTAVATALGQAALMLPLTVTFGLFNTWIKDATTPDPNGVYSTISPAITAVASVAMAYYLLTKLPQLIGGIIGSSVGGGAGIAQSMKTAAATLLGAGAAAATVKAIDAASKTSGGKALAGGARDVISKYGSPNISSNGQYTNPMLRALHRGAGETHSAGSIKQTQQTSSNSGLGSAAKASKSK